MATRRKVVICKPCRDAVDLQDASRHDACKGFGCICRHAPFPW